MNREVRMSCHQDRVNLFFDVKDDAEMQAKIRALKKKMPKLAKSFYIHRPNDMHEWVEGVPTNPYLFCNISLPIHAFSQLFN